MRVTNSMLVSNFMNNLNTNLTKMDKLQNQLASGRKYAHISDNPIAVIYSREARYKLHRLEQYQSGVQASQDWLRQVESSVMELNEIIKNAYEACVDAATDVKGENDKSNASDYIEQMRDHIVTTLNSTLGDKYLFGGYNTPGASSGGPITGPFKAAEELDAFGDAVIDPESGEPMMELTYNGAVVPKEVNPPPWSAGKLGEDVLSFEVGPALQMEATVNGIDLVMFNTKDKDGNDIQMNLYNLMDDLYKAMKSGAGADELNAFIAPLQDAQNHLLTKTAELGGRTNRLDMLEARYEQDYINYSQMLSDAEDADMAEVIMNQKMAEAVYNAALAAGAKIIQPSLMDFLR